MAFVINNFKNVSAGGLWHYKNTDDTLETISASNYFFQMRFALNLNDIIFVVGSDGVQERKVTSVINAATVTTALFVEESSSISTESGMVVNPGSDTDANLIEVGVTGSPLLSWDESADGFDFNKGVSVTGNITASGTVDGSYLAANVVSALDGAAISSATVATDDKVLIQDADDSDNIKYVTAQSIADLGGGGSGGTIASYGQYRAFNSSLNSEYNVTSITENTNSSFDVNFTNNMAESRYSAVGNQGDGIAIVSVDNNSMSASSVRFLSKNSSGSAVNFVFLNWAVFGDLA